LDEKEGHWKESGIYYAKALSISPYSAITYNNLGDLYLKQGQWQKAGKEFNLALAYNPLLLEPRTGLALISLNNAQYQQALELCFKNLDIVSYDTNTLFLLVDIYIHKRDLANVRKYAYRIIGHETDPKVLMKLGVVMAQYHIFNAALDTFIKTIQMSPDYKDAYYEAGRLLENSGKYDEAIHIWELGSSIDLMDRRFKTGINKAMEMKLK
jgi:tetratricopeptide (TPR) repeat protein